MRFLTAGQGAALIKNCAEKKTEVFAFRVKFHFSRGSNKRVPVKNDNSFSCIARQFFQPLAEFQFFRREQFMAEAANFTERCRLAKNKWTSEQLENPAGAVPKPSDDYGGKMVLVQPDRRAARETLAGKNLRRDIGKQFRAGMRIGVHKSQPVAGRCVRAGISRASNLVDRLKHNGRARRARDFRRAVGGIVVADDQFALPADFCESICRLFDLRERGAQQSFFIEGRNDDGNFQCHNLLHFRHGFNVRKFLRAFFGKWFLLLA